MKPWCTYCQANEHWTSSCPRRPKPNPGAPRVEVRRQVHAFTGSAVAREANRRLSQSQPRRPLVPPHPLGPFGPSASVAAARQLVSELAASAASPSATLPGGAPRAGSPAAAAPTPPAAHPPKPPTALRGSTDTPRPPASPPSAPPTVPPLAKQDTAIHAHTTPAVRLTKAGVPRKKTGPKKSGRALSNAEKQKAYRKRLAERKLREKTQIKEMLSPS